MGEVSLTARGFCSFGRPPMSPATEAQRFDLREPWLRFRDPQVEATFTRETFVQSMGFIRAYLVGGTLLYGSFGALDITVGGASTPALLAIRWGVVCPILIGIFGLT